MYRLVDEQAAFLVIDKAPGTHVHRDGEATGLMDRLRDDTGCDTLHLVHRLDAMTSGLLLVARSADAAAALGQALAARQVEKFYLALSDRSPRKKQGWVIGDMERSRRASWKLLPTRQDPAVTQFFSAAAGDGRRLFLLRPRTGRTHQLRVALKSLGAPIWGDPLYHPQEPGREAPDRGYLHSYGLGFMLDGRLWRYVSAPEAGACWPVLPEAWRQPALLPWPGGSVPGLQVECAAE